MPRSHGGGLSVHTERKLLELAQGEGPEARAAQARLVKESSSLVQAVANKVGGPFRADRSFEAFYDDLVQEGLIALLEAIQRFHIPSGNRFSTFAWPTIEGQMRNYLRTGESDRRSLALGDLPVLRGQPDRPPDEIVDDGVDHAFRWQRAIDKLHDHQVMEDALNRLTERQRQVIRLRFWLGMRQVAIAERLEVSRARVHALLSRALERLETVLTQVGA